MKEFSPKNILIKLTHFFIIITRLILIGKLKLEWFDSKWVASKIFK